MRFQKTPVDFIIFVVLSLLVIGCEEPPAAVAPEPPKVTVMHPEQRELSDHEEFNGWMAADKIGRGS